VHASPPQNITARHDGYKASKAHRGGAELRRDRVGENDMKRFYPNVAVAPLVAGWVFVVPASAAPPTVTPSPGYDARLQEQRALSTVHEPLAPYRKPVSRRHVKRIHRAH
jgi:hypothetical protein